MTRWNLIEELKDGVVRYKNPFANSESWFTPGRRHRPLYTNLRRNSSPITLQQPQNYCAFCPAHYFRTTPEKSRYEIEDQTWRLYDRLSPNNVLERPAQIRRIGNLYEIIAFDYWQKNYGHDLSKEQKEHQQAYLDFAEGRDHIINLLMEKQRNKESFIWRADRKQLEASSTFFFGGSHELIVPSRHYIDEAVDSAQLCSTGALTPEEHYYYYAMSIHSANEIYKNNPFVRFVCVYTNWLRDAGASFEHLHRQVLGIDRDSEEIIRGAQLAATTPQIYNDYVAYLGGDCNYVICDNPFAVAVADIGRPYPTIAVFSKSNNLRPNEHSPEEVRGFSDVVHAIHAALGPEKSLNEEWYYSPPSSDMVLPWHVLIKWRNHRLAGIEGIINIFPNEYSPMDIKEMFVRSLISLRRDGRIANIRIDDECNRNELALHYRHYKVV